MTLKKHFELFEKVVKILKIHITSISVKYFQNYEKWSTICEQIVKMQCFDLRKNSEHLKKWVNSKNSRLDFCAKNRQNANFDIG